MEVLSSEGQVRNSSCSDERIILRLALVGHGAGLPNNIWHGGEAGNQVYPGHGPQMSMPKERQALAEGFGEGEGKQS